MDEKALQRWLTRKEELGVFAPNTTLGGPDYRSGEVVREVETMLRNPPVD
jgi:hypothetical protein